LELSPTDIAPIEGIEIISGEFSMNKILSVLLLVAIAAGIVPHAHSLGAPSPPPGVSADKWVAMGDAAGFVITKAGNDFRQGLRSEPNTLNGYFMARIKDSWLRIDTTAGYETHPALQH
jgi:hypothetical protein